MTAAPPPAAPTTPYLRWPPPGLESIHGRLWPLIGVLAIADVILVLPFLAALGTEPAFTSMGPFGRQWWLLLFTTALGIVILTAALQRLVRLSWRGARAARDGHSWRTIVYVAIDESRDTGFLVQGARQFAGRSPRERRLLLSVRVLAATLALAGTLLPPVGLVLGTIAGGLGWIHSAAVWTLGWWIPLVLAAGAALTRITEYVLRRSVKGDAAQRLAEAQALRNEIADWAGRAGSVAESDGPVLTAPGRRSTFRTAAVLLAVVFAGVLATIALLAVGGSIGPVLTSVAVPRFNRVQSRVLEAEVSRDWTVPPDPRITATEAGAALHNLFFVGSTDSTVPFMQRPTRRYDTPFLAADSLPGGVQLSPNWIRDAFASGGRQLTALQRRALRTAAQHPALVDFSTVAAAPEIDVIGTRYVLPFPDSASPITLPIPRFAPMRQAARARLALALADLSEGRTDAAERGVREVISVGLHLIDEGPTLIDALIGTVIVREADGAMDGLLRSTGRTQEADEHRRMRDQTAEVATRMEAVSFGGGVEEALEMMPNLVTDTAGIRGLRWEFYLQITSFAPCMNLHSMVFGPGAEFRAWQERARQTLVRRETDRQYLEFLGRGLFGTGGCIPVVEGLALAKNVR